MSRCEMVGMKTEKRSLGMCNRCDSMTAHTLTTNGVIYCNCCGNYGVIKLIPFLVLKLKNFLRRFK